MITKFFYANGIRYTNRIARNNLYVERTYQSNENLFSLLFIDGIYVLKTQFNTGVDIQRGDNSIMYITKSIYDNANKIIEKERIEFREKNLYITIYNKEQRKVFYKSGLIFFEEEGDTKREFYDNGRIKTKNTIFGMNEKSFSEKVSYNELGKMKSVVYSNSDTNEDTNFNLKIGYTEECILGNIETAESYFCYSKTGIVYSYYDRKDRKIHIFFNAEQIWNERITKVTELCGHIFSHN